jgi:predicted DNA-binding transcriptional regulator AlpA
VADVLANLPSELQQHRILITEEAAAFCGYEVSSWRKLYKSGKAPAPIELSARRYGWKAGTLIRWLNEKAEACGAAEGKAAA